MGKRNRSFEELRQRILWSAKSANFVEFEKAISLYDFDENSVNELLCPKSGDTVIHFAVRSGCLGILKFFSKNCQFANIFTKIDVHGKMPLHIAAQEGSLDCTRFLLSLNVPVDPFKKGDWTPLMLACARGHLDVVQVLTKAGANLHLRNKDGWTAFHIASRTGCLDTLQYLHNIDQSLCYTKSNNHRTPLHTAALHGHPDIVDFLVEKKLSLDEKDACGNNPLMDAVRSNNTQIIHLLLLQNKTSGEASDSLGRNILHIAAECGSNCSMNYIIQNKLVDLNCKSLNGGQTALHYAAKEGHTETVKLLLHSGIDYEIKDSKGRTAADIANSKKYFDCVQEIENCRKL